jgi:hypothetical protein
VLLADPGQSGAYGTAQTLSDPNRRTMQARREVFTEYLVECLRLVGIKAPAIIWSKMSPGTDLEEVNLLATSWGTGLFRAEEIRPALVDDTPPDGVLIPNNAESLARADVDADGSTVNMDGTTSMDNGVGRDNVGLGALSRVGSSSTDE